MQKKEERIKVLSISPLKTPIVKIIDNDLKTLQCEVGGNIEVLYPYEDLVGLICNEEGKLDGLPLNRALCMEDTGEIYDAIAGTFLIVGLTADNFGSLSDELIKKYTEKFKFKEMFFNKDGKIIVIRK